MQDVVINHNTSRNTAENTFQHCNTDTRHVFNIKGVQKQSKRTLKWTKTLTIVIVFVMFRHLLEE